MIILHMGYFFKSFKEDISMTTSSKKGKIDKPGSRETSSRRKRKIVTPARRGTINRATIRRVIRQVMAQRSSS